VADDSLGIAVDISAASDVTCHGAISGFTDAWIKLDMDPAMSRQS
jgi:hypothetical protein